jgi:outer membrane receptor protein involved in Fe transport
MSLILSTSCVLAGAMAFAAGEDEAQIGLTEMIVTAQRRSESPQEVTIAIQAFKASDLEAMGVQSTNDLPEMIPGLVLQPTGASRPNYDQGSAVCTNRRCGGGLWKFPDRFGLGLRIRRADRQACR